jgi:TRAP transporter TAXI family solute receptor
MKKFACLVVALALFLAVVLVQSITSPLAGELPKIITITSYTLGSTGYTMSSGFREGIEKLTPMKVRVEPYGTDVARILPLKNKESELGILTGASGTCASYAMGVFETKEWGPQPLRQVWRGNTLFNSFITRGDSGIRYPKDVKGRKVPFVPGNPAYNYGIEAILAFGNLTWDDVVKVPIAGYIQTIKGVIEGTVDVALVSRGVHTIKELHATPHRAAWVLLPHRDKESWARLQKVAPWASPAVCDDATGLPVGMRMEIQKYPYALWAYHHADENVIYAVVKALHQGYDIFKDMHRDLKEWNIKQAVTDPLPVPYHEGAIRYFKEAGVWTAEMGEWQKKQLEAFESRVAKFKK